MAGAGRLEGPPWDLAPGAQHPHMPQLAACIQARQLSRYKKKLPVPPLTASCRGARCTRSHR